MNTSQCTNTNVNQNHEQDQHAVFCEGVMQSKDALPSDIWIDPKDIKVGKAIGEGAYGVVHEASWLEYKLVVKIVPSNDINVLPKEVAMLSKLRHPHIVQLVGFSAHDDKIMIVMERLDGDLRQLIEEQCKNPPFPQHVAIDIISQIAAGMAYLHEKGIFHGDLKASNVLVTYHDTNIQAKIADFGGSQSMRLTKRCETRMSGDGHPSLPDFGMYSTSSFSGIVGTTNWRAPEVFQVQIGENIAKKKALVKEESVVPLTKKNEISYDNVVDDDDMRLCSKEPSYTAKADVYSFAMTCYEILTGNVPFDELQRLTIHSKVMEGIRPKLPSCIDTKLSNLIQMCWDLDPLKRPTFVEIYIQLQYIEEKTSLCDTTRTSVNPSLYWIHQLFKNYMKKKKFH